MATYGLMFIKEKDRKFYKLSFLFMSYLLHSIGAVGLNELCPWLILLALVSSLVERQVVVYYLPLIYFTC